MIPRLAFCLLAATTLSAADWSDTFLGYRTSSQFREPGIDGTVKKDILQLGHASGWTLGSNFFNVDMLLSDRKDPAQNATSGAAEVYVVYRTALSLGKLTGTSLAFGPVRDISLTAGFDFNAKNNAFASKKRLWVAGPTFHAALPKGFLDLGLWACRERNYNGIVGKDVDFDATWMASLAWAIPFQAGSLGLEFKGYANHVGAKGTDGFGAETRPETLANLALMVDLGTLFGGKPGRIQAGLGYEYWNNKFGGRNHDGPAPATNKPVNAPMLMLQAHF